MEVFEIHTGGMQLFQNLVVNRKKVNKTCVLMYPSGVSNSNYSNKQFVVECHTSKVDIERMKKLDSTYTSESVVVTMLIEDLENTTSLGSNPIHAKTNGFKNDNVIVKYKGIKYIIKEESDGEFDNSVSLICDAQN